MNYQSFLLSVRKHELIIHHDDGLYRHITLKEPGTYNRHYHLTTWPGYLAVSGDMEEWVFSRLEDMFDFFRPRGSETSVSFSYWAEKLQAVDKHSKLKEFDPELYEEAIRHDLTEYLADFSWAEKRKIVQEAHWLDLLEPKDDLNSSIQHVLDFQCPVTFRHPFPDFWDHHLTSYTPLFLWICYAIRWGIKQYDLEKSGRTQAHHDQHVLKGEL